MVTINKATLSSNVWKNFYDRIKAQVKTVSTSDGRIRTVQNYTDSFPDSEIDNKDAYPIIVIESPIVQWNDQPSFTQTKKATMITVNMEVYDSKSESAELLIDSVNNAIETYRKSLRDLGLRFVKLESMDNDEVFRGKIKVHVRRAVWTMEFIFTPTVTY